MKRTLWTIVGVVALLLFIFGAPVLIEFFGPRRTIELRLDGTPDVVVVGHVDIDGVRHPVKETIPARLTYQARRVSFTLKIDPPKLEHELRLRTLIDGVDQLSASVAGGGVYGEVFEPILPRFIFRRRAWIGTSPLP